LSSTFLVPEFFARFKKTSLLLREIRISSLSFSYLYAYCCSVRKAAKHGNRRSTQAAKLFALVSLPFLFLWHLLSRKLT